MKHYGKSKENRSNPIVGMGLFMDADGIPLAFDIFPGNQNEQTTLKPLEKKSYRISTAVNLFSVQMPVLEVQITERLTASGIGLMSSRIPLRR